LVIALHAVTLVTTYTKKATSAVMVTPHVVTLVIALHAVTWRPPSTPRGNFRRDGDAPRRDFGDRPPRRDFDRPPRVTLVIALHAVTSVIVLHAVTLVIVLHAQKATSAVMVTPHVR
jgi:hypothetical protein